MRAIPDKGGPDTIYRSLIALPFSRTRFSEVITHLIEAHNVHKLCVLECMYSSSFYMEYSLYFMMKPSRQVARAIICSLIVKLETWTPWPRDPTTTTTPPDQQHSFFLLNVCNKSRKKQNKPKKTTKMWLLFSVQKRRFIFNTPVPAIWTNVLERNTVASAKEEGLRPPTTMYSPLSHEELPSTTPVVSQVNSLRIRQSVS